MNGKIIMALFAGFFLYLNVGTVSALEFKNVKGTKGECSAGFTLATFKEVEDNKKKACGVLGQWDIVRLADGGSLSGSGYNCKPFPEDDRGMGASLCRAFDSNLPLIVIDTAGIVIPKDASGKTPATMTVYNNASGKNNILGVSHSTSHNIGIKMRGQTSKNFPKQQYGFETWDSSKKDLKVSLLGLPADSDWVLNGPYSDQTLLRNYIAYNLANKMGRYAPRTRFVEVFLKQGEQQGVEGFYVGVYLLIEKIKRGKSRVDVAKLKIKKNKVKGGYILKIDKGNDPKFESANGTTLLYVYPKFNIPTTDPKKIKVIQEKKDSIKKDVDKFENALKGNDFKDGKKNSYTKYIDVDSFVDFFLINEVLKNIDGLRISTYMHKNRNNKLAMGPVWDFNLSMGNVNYAKWPTWKNAEGWYYVTDNVGIPFWWKRLLKDGVFKKKVVDRFNELKQTHLSSASLNNMIDQATAQLEGAQHRNFEKWQTLGTYVWPNPAPFPKTYEEQIKTLKKFLNERVAWVSGNINELGQ